MSENADTQPSSNVEAPLPSVEVLPEVKTAKTFEFKGKSPKDVLFNKIIEKGIGNEQENSKESNEKNNQENKEGNEKVLVSSEEGLSNNQTTNTSAITKDSSSSILKGKFQEKELEIPEEAVFQFRVDGKDEEVSLKDLKRHYQGKVPWEKHFKQNQEFEAKLKAKEVELKQKDQLVEAQFTKILDIFEKNPYAAFEQIAILKGKNPADYLPLYIAQSKKTLEELQELSEAEYKALLIKKKNDFENQKLKEREDALSQQELIREIDVYAASKIREKGITEEDFLKASQAIQEAKVDLSRFSGKEIVDRVFDWIDIDKKFTRLESLTTKINPELAKDSEFISGLGSMVSSSWTDDDIIEVIQGYLGSQISTTNPSSEKPSQVSSKTEEPISEELSEESPAKETSSKAHQRKTEPKVEGKELKKRRMTIDDLVARYS